MKLLAVETSTEYCTVAVSGGERTWSKEALAGQKHSELVLPMIDAVLNDAGMKLVDLDAIAFGAGPGSFTGLRIACGVAQGLAFGLGIPVVAVGTLEALAEMTGTPHVIACLDARMGEIYLAAYRRDAAHWQPLIDPCVCDAATAPLPPGGDWVGCGSGFERYGTTLKQRLGDALTETRAGLFPHAREILRLGMQGFAAGRGVPAEQALPVYIRDKVALKMSEQR